MTQGAAACPILIRFWWLLFCVKDNFIPQKPTCLIYVCGKSRRKLIKNIKIYYNAEVNLEWLRIRENFDLVSMVESLFDNTGNEIKEFPLGGELHFKYI